jgi:hypothetical protein
MSRQVVQAIGFWLLLKWHTLILIYLTLENRLLVLQSRYLRFKLDVLSAEMAILTQQCSLPREQRLPRFSWNLHIYLLALWRVAHDPRPQSGS